MLSPSDKKRVKHCCPVCGSPAENFTLYTQKLDSADGFKATISCDNCLFKIEEFGSKRDSSKSAVIRKFNNLNPEDYKKKEEKKKVLHLNLNKKKEQTIHVGTSNFLDKKLTESNSPKVAAMEQKYTILKDYEEIIWALNAGLVVEQMVNGQMSILVGRQNSFPHTDYLIETLIALGFVGGLARTSGKFSSFMLI